MSFTSSLSPHFLSLPNQTPSLTPFHSSQHLSFPKLHPKPLIIKTVAKASSSSKNTSNNPNPNQPKQNEIVEVEVEEELPWIQEKALDLVEFTGSVTQALPGPRVGPTSLPWILAVPLGYAGLTFVGKNAMLCKLVDELLQRGRDEVKVDDLKAIANKTGFGLEEIVRKYIRYVLNEKPFNPDVVADLIQLRRASTLNDSQVAEILNEISRRIVRDKGPIVMNKSGYTEKGFKRKLAVQALFGKVFYLSELPEFCSSDSSLVVKEIFGVTDEDADQLRLQTTSEAGNLDALEKMADISDSEDSSEAS
ncbi:hypothetical protein TSUD_16970 [Trifolium subterraneum]|uniref:Armadillo-like repeats domain-containing protein n=1 Tax=Trifolium subterraneum TaxID=3900 RepID=A0A2Z6MQ42_TRISU|nr:hypothetical protein TSUD_16970 [Trifolium subterraneum]